ncbi:MAG: DUF2871 domain-containing protein [Christensenellales bacterium]
MKKYLNAALIYAAAALAGGVFYREFTKFNGFEGVTALGKVHPHLFILGMLVFIVIALFAAHNELEKIKLFRVFLIVYNSGVVISTITLLARGITEVLGTTMTNGANAAISGVAGIGHVLVGAGIILLILALKKTAKKQE